jgi:rifampin ADP-ribosylating transferase
MSATLDAATWGAELAVGEGRGRIYVVEPTGAIEDDPDLTNQRYPGNPTKSYRSSEPLRVIAEVIGWMGHSAEEIKTMKDHISALETREE